MDKEKKIEEMLEMIDAKINHIEDITADNRSIIVKLVKQNNSIVEWLKQIDIEASEGYDDYYEDIKLPSLTEKSSKNDKTEKFKELIDEFLSKRESLKELEQELKKHKDMLTPGQMGEA